MRSIARRHWAVLLLLLAALGLASCGRGAAPSPAAPATGSPIAQASPTPQGTAVPYQPPHTKPGPAADRVFFNSFHVDRAPLDLKAGKMDLYFFSLKTAAARELREDPNVRLYEAPASTVSLILNPAPAPEGQLNPFSIKEVRQAMQLLVNRDFIASDIYRGQAVPMLTEVSPLDFDYLTVFDQVRGADVRYDPELARTMIARAMQQAGAQLVNGVWSYRGQPIRLKFIVRVEDERRDVGDLVRAELEKQRFQIAVSYQTFAPAVLSVYSSDPKSFEWHIYTEGWGRSAPQRYDFANINQMYAPWLGNMPGWQEVGFWQYQNEELDTLGRQLFRGQFASLEERDLLYRRMTELGLGESVRIWVATALNSFPAQRTLQGVTQDLVAGPRSLWTLREAYVPGKDTVTVGHLWVWTERTTWNPVGGIGDVYSADMWQNLHDPPLWNHPFTGVPTSFRAKFQVETAGPTGKLDVPTDAVTWDAAADRWQPVASGVRATSKVTFDYSQYFSSRWHDGQPITMADVLYGIAQSYELAFDPDKSRIEVALAVTSRPYLEVFKGYRVLDQNRLEVYVDFWHFVPDYIASYASPTSLSMPWEMLAAMDSLVFNERRAAYSDTAAGRFNVPWLSLVMDRDARLVRQTLRGFVDQKHVPPGVFEVGGRSLVSADEALARYQAALAWFDKYGHLVISNGPFFLARYDPPAQFAELDAFRDSTYPFHPGQWYFGQAPQLAIGRVDAPSTIRSGAEATVKVQVQGPGSLGLRYLLVDPSAGAVLTSGDAQREGAGGSFSIRLGKDVTGTLRPGLYNLFVAAHSDASALLAESKVDLDVKP